MLNPWATKLPFLTVLILLLTGCGSSPDPLINELSTETQTSNEIIHINNCGGMGDSQQTDTRIVATTIKGGAELTAGYRQIVEGRIAAEYGQYRSVSKSQQVVAPPGTDMEFDLVWSEEVRSGTVSLDGSTSNYTVRIPIAVEQTGSRDLGCPESDLQQPTQVSPDPTKAPATPPTLVPVEAANYDQWVICWHGRDGYEYLIAYPESDVEQGVNLDYQLTNAQGRLLELANDSLKMCYSEGEWYGYPDPSPWFPNVSYMKLLDQGIQVCSGSPGCQGDQHMLLPESYHPSNAPELQSPIGTGVHVIAYNASR